MVLLMNLVPYLVIVLISVSFSSVLHGAANYFIDKDKCESGNDDAIVENTCFNIHYDIWTVIFTSIAECVLFYFKGLSVEFFVYSFLVCILIISFITDIKACIIPNETNFIGFIVGISYAFITTLFDFEKGLSLVAGGITGFLIFLAILGFSLLVFKKEGMGGGDIKLMGVIGLFLGFFNTIQVFILSFLIGAVISILLLLFRIKKRDDYIPFGPFIVMAAYFTMFVPAIHSFDIIHKWLMFGF